MYTDQIMLLSRQNRQEVPVRVIDVQLRCLPPVQINSDKVSLLLRSS